MVKLKREEEVIMTEKKVVKKVVEKKEPVKKVVKATVKEVAAAPEVKETVVKAPEPVKEKEVPVKKTSVNVSEEVFVQFGNSEVLTKDIVEKVKDKGVPVICCGEPMQELKAGVTDAAVEKHVPVYTIEGSHVHVVVGETKHPMLEEHFIEWITLNTNQGIYRKQLNPGQEPIADFCLCDGEQVEEVYAYCNLHGLWKC